MKHPSAHLLMNSVLTNFYIIYMIFCMIWVLLTQISCGMNKGNLKAQPEKNPSIVPDASLDKLCQNFGLTGIVPNFQAIATLVLNFLPLLNNCIALKSTMLWINSTCPLNSLKHSKVYSSEAYVSFYISKEIIYTLGDTQSSSICTKRAPKCLAQSFICAKQAVKNLMQEC